MQTSVEALVEKLELKMVCKRFSEALYIYTHAMHTVQIIIKQSLIYSIIILSRQAAGCGLQKSG